MIFEIKELGEKYKNNIAYTAGGKSFTYCELFEKSKEISSEILKEKPHLP